jgi:hypothetical protein
MQLPLPLPLSTLLQRRLVRGCQQRLKLRRLRAAVHNGNLNVFEMRRRQHLFQFRLAKAQPLVRVQLARFFVVGLTRRGKRKNSSRNRSVRGRDFSRARKCRQVSWASLPAASGKNPISCPLSILELGDNPPLYHIVSVTLSTHS